MSLLEALKNSPELAVSFLEASGSVIAVVVDSSYMISDCNRCFTRSMHIPEKPLGKSLANILCPLGNRPFSLLVSPGPDSLLPQVMSLCHSDILYKCYTFATEDGYLVLGEHMGGMENEVLESMSLLNNELSGLSRELGRKNKELEKAYKKITELSRTDSLTGLANRRYFQERYEEFFSLASRQDIPLSLIMMDLDSFKEINDTYGHEAGDSVLKEFGRILRDSCRTEDFPARFGGEEFVAFLPHTTAADAMPLGDRICSSLAESDILENGSRVTVSIGISEKQSADSPESLVIRADKAMYEAKNLGGNQYVIH